MQTKLFARLGFALLASITFMYGQTQSIQVKVPFPFKVGDKVLPAGQYHISEAAISVPMLKIESTSSPTTVAFEPILTGLAAQDAALAAVVFDKVNDIYSLSEVWIPGTDGYLVRSTAEKHQHEIVRPERQR